MPGYKGMRTLCEILREISRTTDKVISATSMRDILEIMETINEKTYDAILMAKRMDKKLREYKTDYDRGWFEGYCCVCQKPVKGSLAACNNIYCNDCKNKG